MFKLRSLYVWVCGFFVLQSTWALSAQEKLDSLLQSPEFAIYVQNKEQLKLQIIYSEIQHKKSGRIEYDEGTFHYDPKNYFYPASLVKLPLSIFVMETFDSLKKVKNSFSAQMPFRTESVPCSPAYPLAKKAFSTFEREIQKMLIISDNEAYNRHFEFLGRDAIRKKLDFYGLNSAMIRHRFSVCSEEQNKVTNAFLFGNPLFYKQEMRKSEQFPDFAEPAFVGKSWLNSKGELQNKPYDFTTKNRMDLMQFHRVLQNLIYPGSVAKMPAFRLSSASREFLMNQLKQTPKKANIKGDDGTDYDDNYTQYLYYGQTKKMPQKSGLKIYNIVGQSYGFLSDVAYFKDDVSGQEFFLSAVIYANKSDVINSGSYDYKNIGFPFLAKLGQALVK